MKGLIITLKILVKKKDHNHPFSNFLQTKGQKLYPENQDRIYEFTNFNPVLKLVIGEVPRSSPPPAPPKPQLSNTLQQSPAKHSILRIIFKTVKPNSSGNLPRNTISAHLNNPALIKSRFFRHATPNPTNNPFNGTKRQVTTRGKSSNIKTVVTLAKASLPETSICVLI